MTKPSLSTTGLAFLLISLGTACSSADVGSLDGEGSTDDGTALHSWKTTDGDGKTSAHSWKVDGGNDVDGGASTDGGNKADGGNKLDSGSGSDGGNNVDAGSDGGNKQDGGGMGSPSVVNLGTAGNFVILSKAGISTVPASVITGNIGVSPVAATYITGFSLIADSSNVFSISPQVTGKVYAADYAVPTPSNLTTAVGDMQLAFTDAAGRAPGVTELGAGNIGGMTLPHGVYKWSSSVLIPTNVTLTGSATDVWIMQIAQNLTVSSATKVSLAGGALPKNVFWQVSGAVDFGTTSHFEGIVLSQTAITLQTGASINGRLLAQTAVTLDTSTVVQP
ncbi:MAG TPA: ice-binding family protein [Polyangiaceae bacterium]